MVTTKQTTLQRGSPPDAEAALASMERDKENLLWIDEQASELFEKYGVGYIAVNDKSVIANSPDVVELFSRIEFAGFMPGDVTIEYLQDPEIIYIL